MGAMHLHPYLVELLVGRDVNALRPLRIQCTMLLTENAHKAYLLHPRFDSRG